MERYEDINNSGLTLQEVYTLEMKLDYAMRERIDKMEDEFMCSECPREFNFDLDGVEILIMADTGSCEVPRVLEKIMVRPKSLQRKAYEQLVRLSQNPGARTVVVTCGDTVDVEVTMPSMKVADTSRGTLYEDKMEEYTVDDESMENLDEDLDGDDPEGAADE